MIHLRSVTAHYRPKRRVEAAFLEPLLDVRQSDVPRPLEGFFGEPVSLILAKEFENTFLQGQYGFGFRYRRLELGEVNAVIADIRSAPLRVDDATPGDGPGHRLRDLADLEVLAEWRRH